MSTRTETDSIGAIEVPADAYWGAQTQRSKENFAIGGQQMPLAVVHALAQVKKPLPASTPNWASCHRSWPI